mgnify:CR=1 FL=1
MEDYLTNRNKGVNKNGTFVYGSVEGKFRKYFSWDANIKYHLFGYRSQDLELGGDVAFSVYIAGKPITLKSVRPTSGRRTISLTTMRGTTLLRKSLKPESLRP